MRAPKFFWAVTAGLVLAPLSHSIGAVVADLPANLARTAQISATSEFSSDYRARFVAGGDIPDANSKDDLGRAWCINGRTHQHGAGSSFTWDDPVTVGEII